MVYVDVNAAAWDRLSTSLPSLASVLRVALGRCLPAGWIPAISLTNTPLPTSSNGKLDRTAALDLFQRHVPAFSKRPLTPMELLVAEHWQFLLGPFNLHPEADYITLGGDSMSAMRCATRLQASLAASVVESQRTTGLIQGPFAPSYILQYSRLCDYAAHLARFVDCPAPLVEEDRAPECCLDDATALLVELQLSDDDAPQLQTQGSSDVQTLFNTLAGLCLPGWVGLLLEMSQHGCLQPKLNVNGGYSRVKLGQSPLHLAAGQGDVATLKLLLEAGAKPTITNPQGVVAAHVAASKSAEALLLLLVGDFGQSISARGRPDSGV